ncbi:hypothetical protein D018_3146A, partial [Vibrio parahaemolyticus VP2007-007]
MPANIPPK